MEESKSEDAILPQIIFQTSLAPDTSRPCRILFIHLKGQTLSETVLDFFIAQLEVDVMW